MSWLTNQWNEPDRNDYYLMQVAKRILELPNLVWGEIPPEIDTEEMKLKWGKEDQDQQDGKPHPPIPEDEKRLSKEEVAELNAKLVEQRWLWAVGVGRNNNR